MLISDMLEIGDLMEVEVEGQYYATKTEELNGNLITVEHLTTQGMPLHLREGEIYVMLKKSSAGLYFFNARYERRFKTSENRYYMEFLAISEPVKNQRRQSFRVPLKLDVKLLVVHSMVLETTLAAAKTQPRKKDLAKTWLNTYARDVSETGMLLYMDEPAAIGSHVMLQFELNDDELFTNAVVRRHSYQRNSDTRPNMIGVEFLELDESTARIIRKFVIDYQIWERTRVTDQLI